MVFRGVLLVLAAGWVFAGAAEGREIRTAEEAMRLGDRAFVSERYAAAESFYRKASELAPKHAAPVAGLGRLLYAQSRYTEAQEAFMRARLLKKDIATRKFLDCALEKMEELGPLLARIESAQRGGDGALLDSLHAEAAQRLSKGPSYMALLGPHLEYLLKQRPRDPDLLRTLAEGYFHSSAPEHAFAYYERLTDLKPRGTTLWRRSGDVAVNVGAYDDARLYYKKALREAFRSGNTKEIREFKKLVRRLPEFTGKIEERIQAGDLERAFRELRKCLVRNPSHSWAVVRMGKVYEEIGRLRQAENLYRQAVKWHYEDPNAHYALGQFYLMRKKEFEPALEEFKLARVLLAEYGDWAKTDGERQKVDSANREVTRSIAYVYLETLQRPKKAIEELKTLLDVEKPDARDQYALGVAYLRDRQKDSSYRALKKAIEMDPDSETARDAEEIIETLRIRSRDGFAVEVR